MECLPPDPILSQYAQGRRIGADVFHMPSRVRELFDCALRAHVLWDMRAQAEYYLLHLSRTHQGEDEVIFYVITT